MGDGVREQERVESVSLVDTLDPWLVMFTVLCCMEVFLDTLETQRTLMESSDCCMREPLCPSSWNRLEVFLQLERNVSWKSLLNMFINASLLLWDPRMLSKRFSMLMPPTNRR